MSKFLQDPRAAEGEDRPAAVSWRDAFHAHEGEADEVAVLGTAALARVRAAHSAIQSLVGVLIDREVVMSDSNDPVMSTYTATGLLEAIACCAELAELHATGGGALWTSSLEGERGAHVRVLARGLAAAEQRCADGKRPQQTAKG